tara:strand:- start:15509 stop:17131 length:1623 start_codon:yes stop_codon:yes gene_type:complete
LRIEMDKISEAQEILKELGLPKAQQNKICALTFLALCGIKPDDVWQDVSSKSYTLSKGIMDFVNDKYGQDYKPNTRESFRKQAINPFLDHRIIDLNPDDPNLSPQSSKTHYAIKPLIVETLKSFGTINWNDALENFKKYQFEENIEETAIIQNIKIGNFKSIYDMEIELGRFNVFIGANGSGKSNVLEALAMIGASKDKALDLDGLMSRGVRIAKPTLTLSSFLGKPTKKNISIEVKFNDSETVVGSTFQSSDDKDIYAKWKDQREEDFNTMGFINFVKEISGKKELSNELTKELEKIKSNLLTQNNTYSNKYLKVIADFLIYNLSTQTLRGLKTDSYKVPLGINGEGLDLLLNNLNRNERLQLDKCKIFFDWLEELKFDKDDSLKYQGYKLGKSGSILYFSDKFMLRKNNILSAENANEGILHVLFYLALFISSKTPNFFAIDNIETALNPKLCRALIKELANLSETNNKQAIITTHNPAILDGLNLNDDSQRLFEVYRTDEGMTRVRRIKFKKDLSDKPMKLSEMWTKGLLGGIPNNF